MSLVQGYWRRKIEVLPLLTGDEPKEPQQLELKPLPVELKYAFLEENGQCPVVISSLLTTSQEHNLLHLLKRNKQALGWKISDLKGINPAICTITFRAVHRSKTGPDRTGTGLDRNWNHVFWRTGDRTGIIPVQTCPDLFIQVRSGFGPVWTCFVFFNICSLKSQNLHNKFSS